MIYTLAKMREFSRALDNRLMDTAEYTDDWINERIEEGLGIAQDLKVIFYTQELYDLTTNTDPVSAGGDGLTDVEIVLQKEPHSVYTVECNLDYFSVEITANNHVIISVIPNTPVPIDRTVLVRYFFYPTLPFESLEMSMEMYRLVKPCIAANLFSWLSDEVNEKVQLDKANSMLVRSTFDIEKDLLAIPDTRLWRGSWA
jgi:hypothetical protein